MSKDQNAPIHDSYWIIPGKVLAGGYPPRNMVERSVVLHCLLNTFLRFLDKAFINKDSSQSSSDLFLRAIAVKAIYIWCRSGPELFYRIHRGKDLS